MAPGSNIIVVDIDDWDGFILKEAVFSFIGHMGGIIAEDGLHLDMKVTYHGAPGSPIRHLFVAYIHPTIEQGHTPTSSQGSITDFRGFDSCSMRVDSHGIVHDFRDIIGLH
jgi:hypothetical protein